METNPFIVLCAVQARMNSTRLPGKMLKTIGSKTVLSHILNRVKKSQIVDKVVLATGLLESNNLLIDEAVKNGFDSFRGDDELILNRYYECAKNYCAKTIVRITGDSPLVDSTIIDKTIRIFNKSSADYASNLHPNTYPVGLGVEVFSFDALFRMFYDAKTSYERGTTSFFWGNRSKFKCVNLFCEEDLSDIRLTLDYQEDLNLFLKLDEKFGFDNLDFEKIIEYIYKFPELFKINECHSKNNINNLIKGRRFLCIPVSDDDISLISSWISNAFVNTYDINGFSTNTYIKNEIKIPQNIIFILKCIHSEEKIGFGGIYNICTTSRSGEIKILIGNHQYRGLGIGSELVHVFSDYAFNKLNLNSLYAIIPKDNRVAIQCFIKNQFKYSGCLRQQIYSNSNYVDLLFFDLLRSGYENE